MALSVPIDAVSVYNKALDLSLKGDFSTAINEYKRAIDICPTFIEAYNNIGEIYSKQGMSDLALSTYQNALNYERNHRLLLNIGVEHYNYGKYKAALDYFLESLNIKPDFLEGNYYSGLTLFNLKSMSDAELFFSKVVKMERQHIKANYLLSYINYDWKKYSNTLLYLDNIKDIADDKVFINKYYGFCYYHLGRYNDAIKHLTIAVESNPKYYMFKDYLKGLTVENKMKEIGDVDAKIREMEAKMAKEKPSIKDCTSLSVLYMYKGDYKKAENILLEKKRELVK